VWGGFARRFWRARLCTGGAGTRGVLEDVRRGRRALNWGGGGVVEWALEFGGRRVVS
jgi:hypothetical protein